MIIFGWNFQTIKQVGVFFRQVCEHCKNEEYWVLTRTITWFTLFFIPVIPYSLKYFLSCPICKYGLVLDQKQLSEIKPIAEVNQQLVDGKITQEEYKFKIFQLNNESVNSVQAEIAEVKMPNEEDSNLKYCGNCRTGIIKEFKFCGNCGKEI